MTDKQILNLAQAELRAMYKRLGINGSNVLTLIDEALRQPLVSGTCAHDNTVFQNIRCNVCTDCGEVVEIDV